MSEKIVQLNEEVIKVQIKELVRESVEETLNELLEKEAEQLTQAARYERSEARQGYRSGHYDRNLTTTSGDVTLHVPRLKGVSFETAIIERYRRRESSVEEALIEMYLAGVSVRRVEDITEALWGSAEDYREYKPMMAQLNAIKFKKRREDFQKEHDRELTLFYIADCELKPHFTKEGKLPLTAWKNELAKLTEERAVISADYSELYHESMQLLNIRKCVEDIRRRQEQTQHKQHHHER